MTVKAAFTQATVRRAISAARKEGLYVTNILADGTVLVRDPQIKPEVFKEPPFPEYSDGAVYFVQNGNSIKIGYSASWRNRIADLQVAAASKLKVLAVVPGDRTKEVRFHKKFHFLRQNGEWFRAAAPLLEFIATLIEQPE